jgi:hypothetical protein
LITAISRLFYQATLLTTAVLDITAVLSNVTKNNRLNIKENKTRLLGRGMNHKPDNLTTARAKLSYHFNGAGLN